MAKIEMRPDNSKPDVWWLYWVERDEIIARIDQGLGGRCTATRQGPHWSSTKSFGRSFDDPADALAEVQLYFERR